MRKVFLCTFLFVSACSQSSVAQVVLNKDSSLTISGYADVYAAFYTDSVGHGNFQKFPTVSPRHALGLNIAVATLKYSQKKYHVVIGLHYGDIPLSAWSPRYNNIQEAYAGFRLSKKIWIDGGFFRTHTGAEGLMPKENITSSISVATFNEPYYEGGVKLNYKPSPKLTLDFYLLNGYNIYADNNANKSFGMLASYTVNDKLNMGYSNYIGDDTPDSIVGSHLRNFENIFLNYEKKKFKLQVAVDFITQGNSDIAGTGSAQAWSGFATFKYKPCKKAAVYSRGEFFSDADGFLDGVLIDTKSKTTGIKLWGLTLGAEYKPTGFSYIRLEARQLQCDKAQEIFRWKGDNKAYRSEIMFHIGCFF